MVSLLFICWDVRGTTIAIIDTGFDLDNEFLKPKILKQETDEEAVTGNSKEFHGWNFHDNSHLKEAVIKDQSSLQEILLFRNIRAKGHREGLSLQEFEWFKRKSSDKEFMEMVKRFKKHSHGTFVAGIALREGENINIFPIRGLDIPIPMVVVDDSTSNAPTPLKSKKPDDKFKEEIKNSINRVSRKFSKICHYISLKGIQVVNASYGITYKNTMTKFREKYRELTEKEIEEHRLQEEVNKYFEELYLRSTRTIKKYPNILFVFSAGNSGLNNDTYPHYPSKIKLPNTISVGAMNGDYLASFSNFGEKSVDIGAPGVAILSLVPKVYSQEGEDLYSPASGTSMAAPYISNLAAQIMNTNKELKPEDVKRIILETGDEKLHLKSRLLSGSKVNNQKALKVALLSRDMTLDEAINLGTSDLIPMEDSISIKQPPAVGAEELKQKVMDSIPQDITPQVLDETETTSEESSLLNDPKREKPDNSVPPPSTDEKSPASPVDPAPSSQSEEQSPPPSEGLPPSSSPAEPQPQETEPPKSVPSSP